MKSLVLYAAVLLLLHQALMTFAFNTAAHSAANDGDHTKTLSSSAPVVGGAGGRYRRARRGWSMMRLGRGLQMLRLGKRTAPLSLRPSSLPFPPSLPPSSSSLSHVLAEASTPEKMRQLLALLLEEERSSTRHPFRRQPPMPRYGREVDEDDDDEEEDEEVTEERQGEEEGEVIRELHHLFHENLGSMYRDQPPHTIHRARGVGRSRAQRSADPRARVKSGQNVDMTSSSGADETRAFP